MANLDDVVAGFAWAWNQFVAGNLKPEAFLKRGMGAKTPDGLAEQMGRRLAAEKYAALTKGA